MIKYKYPYECDEWPTAEEALSRYSEETAAEDEALVRALKQKIREIREHERSQRTSANDQGASSMKP